MQRAKATAYVLILLLMNSLQRIDASEQLEPEASSRPSRSLTLDFMPDEIKIEVMHHLPAQSIGNLSSACRSLYKVRSPALKNLIKDLTLNVFLRASEEDIYGLPATLITACLNNLMATETFVLLPTDSCLKKFLPSEFVSSTENRDALYEPLFGQPLPQWQEDLAREHLDAIVTLYRKATVHPTPLPLLSLACSLHVYGTQRRIKSLSFLCEEEESQVAITPHTFVLTDLELGHDEFYDKVTHLLSEQDEHHLVVNVGSWVVEGGNWLRVPSNVRHLTLINPKGDITGLGSDFLQGHKNLERLHINLPKVTTIANRMLDDCNKLTHATFFLPALTSLGDCFLRYCFKVRRVDLYIPAIATMGGAFLYQCESLWQFSLYAPQLKTVGDYFMYRSSKLACLRLYIPEITKMGPFSLCLCPNLTLESIQEIKTLLRERNLEDLTHFDKVQLIN